MEFTQDHIHIRCEDVEKTVAWYQKMFDAKLVAKGDAKGMPIYVTDTAGYRIAFSPKREGMEVEPLTGKHRWGVWQLGFGVKDLDAAMAELKARGAEFDGEPWVLGPALRVAFVKAPDGVQVELLQRG